MDVRGDTLATSLATSVFCRLAEAASTVSATASGLEALGSGMSAVEVSVVATWSCGATLL